MCNGKPALCSACDPEIGQWHGQFPKTPAADYEAQHGEKSVRYRIINGQTIDLGYRK